MAREHDRGMNDTAENAASRLWRDRAQIREHERDEAQSRARIAEEKVAALTEENDRLADKNMHLRAQNDRLAAEIARLSGENERLANESARLRASSASDAVRARSETEQQMAALRTELLSVLDHMDKRNRG